MTVPGQPEINATWMRLPAETRDRIGFVAVDMVFQSFVSGEAYPPVDRAVLDDAVRGAAAEAENLRLNEIHRVVEAALPDLFGTDGENPAWSENAGPTPTPAVLAAVAAEAAEEADRGRREWSLRVRLGRKGLRLWCGRDGYIVYDRATRISKTGTLDLGATEAWLAGEVQ